MSDESNKYLADMLSSILSIESYIGEKRTLIFMLLIKGYEGQ